MSKISLINITIHYKFYNDTNLINEATSDASKKTSAYLKESEILDVIKYKPSTNGL